MIESLLAALGFVIIGLILICAYDRWIQPRITRQWISKTLKKIQTGDVTPPCKRSDYSITFDAAGFAVSKIRPTSALLLSIAWSDVLRVTAFKRDWLTVDCICIAIATKEGTTIEVNEEMEGWEAFTEGLPKYLPGSRRWTECFSQVAFPAFATNETQMFARECSPSMASSGVE